MRLFFKCFILCLLSEYSYAGMCYMSITGVNFGYYDVFSPTPSDSSGSIDIQCEIETSITIHVDSGYGSYVRREMRSGSNKLFYNLYKNPTMTMVLGDGTMGTSVLTGIVRSDVFYIYGRMPPQQNVRVGTYTDSIFITLYF